MRSPAPPPADVLVLGGGLAGSTLATLLARAGRSVTLLEKSSAPHHKVCGEFLSHEALGYLQQQHVDLAALGAVPIHTVRLAAKSLIAQSPLPFPAMSLTRRALDECLLQQAASAGVHLLRGQRVNALAPDTPHPSQWTATLDDGTRHSGTQAFLATGKHDLTGRPRPASRQNDLVAFKMYFRLSPAQQAALGYSVDLILFPGGYAGLQPVEAGLANLCLLVTRAHLKRCGGAWPDLLHHIQQASPFLTARLHGAQPQLDRPLALSAIPYGHLQPTAPDGLWRLGDQAAVIPSFSGDGMSIALHSAHRAASTYLSGGSAQTFQNRVFHDLRSSVGFGSQLSRLLVSAPQLAHLVQLWPALLGRIATSTRVPGPALLRSAP